MDLVTGCTYCIVGDAAEVMDGASVSDATMALVEAAEEAAGWCDWESIIVTSAHRHHLVHAVRGGGDPLLLVTALDRQRTNMAFAIRDIRDQAESVLT
ncbi:hypothetical protein [Streptomyces sp. NBC_00424]|uniref:hypothetical protein n=1 Tax=Streptomyces sp. NBC_00424 TaxID=2903648 RepID=UPI0022586F86|nr:hypothetical protein [Streptomyces sp. NBC_00424]